MVGPKDSSKFEFLAKELQARLLELCHQTRLWTFGLKGSGRNFRLLLRTGQHWSHFARTQRQKGACCKGQYRENMKCSHPGEVFPTDLYRPVPKGKPTDWRRSHVDTWLLYQVSGSDKPRDKTRPPHVFVHWGNAPLFPKEMLCTWQKQAGHLVLECTQIKIDESFMRSWLEPRSNCATGDGHAISLQVIRSSRFSLNPLTAPSNLIASYIYPPGTINIF